MTWTIAALAAFCLLTLGAHLVSAAVAAKRCRLPRSPFKIGTPPVSIVQPVCGDDDFLTETLRSTLRVDYPVYEVIYCVARADDPAVPVIRRLIAENPHLSARLLIGDERISRNPKLNNVYKGWREACHDWIVIADSNVLMPRDSLRRLLATWRTDTGLVCSPPAGCAPSNVWAELECAFLNAYQARWQYFSDSIGFGFAQGKTMLWRREDIERTGGIRALGSETAEDAAATKLVRAAGLRVHLVDAPFGQPLGKRGWREVWHRQLRWARLRRASFPGYFAAEAMCGSLPPLAAALFLAAELDIVWPIIAIPFLGLWYGAEILLTSAANWPLSIRTVPLAMLRDAMLPVVWVAGWTGNSFVWRGNTMEAAEGAKPAP